MLYFSEFWSHQKETLGQIANAIAFPAAADMSCVQFPAITCRA